MMDSMKTNKRKWWIVSVLSHPLWYMFCKFLAVCALYGSKIFSFCLVDNNMVYMSQGCVEKYIYTNMNMGYYIYIYDSKILLFCWLSDYNIWFCQILKTIISDFVKSSKKFTIVNTGEIK